MTAGQARAVRELERLQFAAPNDFELVKPPDLVGKTLSASISIRLGPMQTKKDGLKLREREEFTILVPEDFPFDYPSVVVSHDRFAGFPHVIWSKWICLYQSKIEWNPSDGLYGLFSRLNLWLGRAAVNDMDPQEGPLEPPHHATDFSQVPFLIRSNAPVAVGESWFGLAELENHPNRIELVAWNDLSKGWPEGRRVALAVILPKPLPMEFPQKGKEFFAELMKQGLERTPILRNLALAALLSPSKEPIHLVLGIPMRRATDGSPRLHIAVWTTDAKFQEALLHLLPDQSDSAAIQALRQDLADKIFTIFEQAQISWCQVMEEREEIVVRRDSGTPAGWFKDKKVLLLGCGALGSWIAEVITRARPKLIHLVDNSIVKPGLLVRQNYQTSDIGSSKAEALAARLQEIASHVEVQPILGEAHAYLINNSAKLSDYDVILDCTASAIFQMKLERDWKFLGGRTPPIISTVIDAKARHCLTIVLEPDAPAGIWNAFVVMKQRLCPSSGRSNLISAFYSDKASAGLFQPEPGCSDPTFVGSAADILSLSSTALNLAVSQISSENTAKGLAFSLPSPDNRAPTLEVVRVPDFDEVDLGQYRVRIQKNVYREAKAWVRKINRRRSSLHETGGLLWGLWDSAVGVIWIFDLSGPPRDSLHDPGHFVCGIHGTVDEHKHRYKQSYGACGFVGFWHTHPDMPSQQSITDVAGMAELVSNMGQNQKQSVMLIFGRTGAKPTVGAYVYESHSLANRSELISIGQAQIQLETQVV